MAEIAAPPLPDKGVISRAVGIIVSPAETFRTVIAQPRPAIILILVCLVFAVATTVPQLSERGRQSVLDAQVQAIERSTHQPITPDRYAAIEKFSHYTAIATAVSTFVTIPIVCLLLAAVFWALFNAILGGTASFKQVVAIVTHSQVIPALGAVLGAPLVWMNGMQSMAGPFNLGALAPMLDQDSHLLTFLRATSVFSLWQIVVTAIGLGVLYRRRPAAIAVALLLVYLLLVGGFSTFLASLTQAGS
jgi:hypothetical protein